MEARKPSEPTIFSSAARIGIFVLCLLTLIPVIWVATAFNIRHRQCVALPNGAFLGYAAVFDLSQLGLKPIVVPKLGDGTPIVPDKLWSIKVSGTTIYGSSFETGYRFAWRADTGLVLHDGDPVTHEEVVADAGPVNAGVEFDAVDAGYLFAEMKSRAGTEVVRCPTRLLTW